MNAHSDLLALGPRRGKQPNKLRNQARVAAVERDLAGTRARTSESTRRCPEAALGNVSVPTGGGGSVLARLLHIPSPRLGVNVLGRRGHF